MFNTVLYTPVLRLRWSHSYSTRLTSWLRLGREDCVAPLRKRTCERSPLPFSCTLQACPKIKTINDDDTHDMTVQCIMHIYIIPVQIHGCRVPVERVCRVGVRQQLRQERLEDVREVVKGSPGLIDHVQADRPRHLINIWMVDLKENT